MDNHVFMQDVIILDYYNSLILFSTMEEIMTHKDYFVIELAIKHVWTKKIDYEDFITQLYIHGCAGFEQYTASHLIEDYICKYATKGGINSDNWNISFQSICNDYIDDGQNDKTTRSLYAKYMNEIVKADSKTQDECVFLLAGGILTTNTVITKKCSINSTMLDNI